MLDVEWGGIGQHLQVDAALWGSYAHDPVVVFRGGDRLPLVAHRLGTNLTGNIAVFDRLELLLDVPVLLWQTGVDVPPSVASGTIATAGPGDLRLAPKLGLLNSREHVVDLAVIAAVTLPTGLLAGDAALGEGQVTIVPELAVSRAFTDGRSDGGLRLASNVGFRIRPAPATVLSTTIGNEITWRAGAGYRLTPVPVELGLTVSGSIPVSGTSTAAPVETLAGVTVDATPWLAAFAGAGVGVVAGVGVPDLRGFAGVRLHAPGKRDSDGDGLDDATDACKDAAEDLDGHDDGDGCPDLDDDNDGIADDVDRCKDGAEDTNGYQDDDGCPDGGPPAPVDRDGDGVVDTDDACPDVAAATTDGCPPPPPPPAPPVIEPVVAPVAEPVVAPVVEPLTLPQHVLFASGSTTLTSASTTTLATVVAALRAHPEVTRVEVIGFTDDQGSAELNERLSLQRAEVVRAWLIKKGIASTRVVAVARGATAPFDDNTTDAGRAKNRRVVFQIGGAP